MEQTYKLNMIPTAVPVVVRVSQYDVGLRTITFNLLNGSETYEVPSGSAVSVRGVKTDATAFEYACTYSGSTVTFDIQEQMTVLAGKEICEIRITNNGEILGSANFIMFVESAPIDEDTPISETDLPLIEQAVQAAAEIIATAETVLDDWMTSEGITIIQNWTQDWLDEHGITYDSALSSTSENAVQNKVITEALETKAEINGYYEDMTVGNALQLISSNYVEDSTPYNFRTSGGSADIGNRNELELVGGSIVWNQYLSNTNLPTDSAMYSVNTLTSNNVTFTKNANGGYTISTTSEGASDDASFKIGSTATVPSFTNGHKNAIFLNGAVSGVKMSWGGSEYTTPIIYARGSTTGFNMWLKVESGTVITTPIEVYPLIFDLTQMFGSTVADYIYSLEQATSGAGVAYFRKLFPKSYYPYNAGEMMHVVPSEYITTGLNLYDHSVGTAKLVGGQQYQITGAYTSVSYVDFSGNAETLTISNTFFTPTNSGTLTVVGGNDSTTCVHLVWSGTHNGEYEPYETHTYSFDNLTLRGIPKVDASGNLYYDGDTYSYDGTVTRKYGIRAYQSGDASDGSTMITDGSTYTVYALSATTTESATPYSQYQVVNDWGTEELTDYEYEQGNRDVAIPVGNNSKYPTNLVDKLNHLPTLADADGDYIIRQSGTQMSLVSYADVHELPDAPTTDGTYTLKCTVANGVPTYTWESE